MASKNPSSSPVPPPNSPAMPSTNAHGSPQELSLEEVSDTLSRNLFEACPSYKREEFLEGLTDSGFGPRDTDRQSSEVTPTCLVTAGFSSNPGIGSLKRGREDEQDNEQEQKGSTLNSRGGSLGRRVLSSYIWESTGNKRAEMGGAAT